jgi:hypothetical protein
MPITRSRLSYIKGEILNNPSVASAIADSQTEAFPALSAEVLCDLGGSRFLRVPQPGGGE